MENADLKTDENAENKPNIEEKSEKLNEQNLRFKIEKEVREKLEKEAQLSAEEKLNERIKELEDEKNAVLVDKNRTKAEREFISKGLNQGNYNEILDFLVSDNEEITLDRIGKIIGFIEVNSKNMADEQIKKTMKDVAKPENSEEKEQSSNENIAQKLGKTAAQTHKTALETLKKYI